jgi:post-segregation antitoxin (ccd killing protein)
MTGQPKRKISVTLDADLVADLEAEGENLSAHLNAALRADLEHRRRRKALGMLLDTLAEERGSLDTAEDIEEIARFARLLGGAQGSNTADAASAG